MVTSLADPLKAHQRNPRALRPCSGYSMADRALVPFSRMFPPKWLENAPHGDETAPIWLRLAETLFSDRHPVSTALRLRLANEAVKTALQLSSVPESLDTLYDQILFSPVDQISAAARTQLGYRQQAQVLVQRPAPPPLIPSQPPLLRPRLRLVRRMKMTCRLFIFAPPRPLILRWPKPQEGRFPCRCC